MKYPYYEMKISPSYSVSFFSQSILETMQSLAQQNLMNLIVFIQFVFVSMSLCHVFLCVLTIWSRSILPIKVISVMHTPSGPLSQKIHASIISDLNRIHEMLDVLPQCCIFQCQTTLYLIVSYNVQSILFSTVSLYSSNTKTFTFKLCLDGFANFLLNVMLSLV